MRTMQLFGNSSREKKVRNHSGYEHAAALILDFLQHHENTRFEWSMNPQTAFRPTPELKVATDVQRATTLLLVSARIAARAFDNDDRYKARALYAHLARRSLPLADDDFALLLDDARKVTGDEMSLTPILTQLEQHLDGRTATGNLAEALEHFVTRFGNPPAVAAERKLAARAEVLLQGATGAHLLDPRDPWAAEIVRDLLTLPAPQRNAWEQLLAHAATARASKPGKAWLRKAAAPLDTIGPADFRARMESWSPLLVATVYQKSDQTGETWREYELLEDRNADILRGLVWCFAAVNDPHDAPVLGLLADRCFQKVPEIGAFSTKAGNACLYVLGQLPGTAPVAQLSRIRNRVKLKSIRAQVEKALNAAAERAGVSPDELEEIATPDFGLDTDGTWRMQLGDVEALLDASDGRTGRLAWRRDGKTIKSVPKVVKDEHADELKALRAAGKEIQKTLATVRLRLEQLPIRRRRMSLQAWRERYHDHSLVRLLARRLIWSFTTEGAAAVAAAWDGAALCDATGRAYEPPADATVELWHPVQATADEVLAWRTWLEAREITQPFKQAHREIYLVTPAELETDVYSNRFAAHILKQHQLNALAQQRCWQTGLLGAFDSENNPRISLPAWQMHAEYYLEGGEITDDNLSPHGILLLVSSDQVRFLDEGGEPIRIADVPPLVFSEVMRDVDLFVGVASIGADPEWADGGAELRAYWGEYSFGELSTSAEDRKTLLAGLLPRLAIADRTSIDGRFLTVRGKLRSYRIHLGSGNILMAPNDQYLCIVAARSTQAEKVYLPFEGDRMLALILSKAFMLVDDDKIKDPQIRAQIS